MLLIGLTDEGRALVQELLPKVHQEEVMWMSCLDAEEQETLINLLGKVQSHLYTPIQLPQARELEKLST